LQNRPGYRRCWRSRLAIIFRFILFVTHEVYIADTKKTNSAPNGFVFPTLCDRACNWSTLSTRCLVNRGSVNRSLGATTLSLQFASSLGRCFSNIFLWFPGNTVRRQSRRYPGNSLRCWLSVRCSARDRLAGNSSVWCHPIQVFANWLGNSNCLHIVAR